MAIHSEVLEEIRTQMRTKLGAVVPEVEILYKSELVQKINRLKREKGAIILGHNYMEPALFHTVPDVVGDSLELSRKAAAAENDIIIFCGVRFMAETAKILNPNRTVLLPARRAGCSLAESITAADVRELKKRFPGVPVVTYINTYADVKAESDICCTSGNAVRVVNSLDSDTIIFLPDEYLARNVAQETGKKIIVAQKGRVGSFPEGTDSNPPPMLGWHGRCEVHEQFSVDDIVRIRSQFPGTAVLAHPECSPEVVQASDFAASTSKMIDYVRHSGAPHFLILTECSMADNIIADNPDRDILRLCSIRCPHMNEITLEDTLRALEENETEIFVPEAIADRARGALERMLAI